jgi:CSLREA domain-containing protein
VTDDYVAMWGATSNSSPSNTCLGSVTPSQPIMQGISDVCEGSSLQNGLSLTEGSSEVVRWDSDQLFVAVKDNRTVVSINGYVGLRQWWSGQMDDVVHNAILWLVTPPTVTWTVNTTDDEDDGECAALPDGDCTLREAVKCSAAGDRIEFDLPELSTITLGGSEILIDKDLTIAGPGADLLAISGAGLSRVFRFPDAYVGFAVTISGLTIKDGQADIGGGIYLGHHATLSMNDCVIGPHNIATANGGGIANVRGVLTLNRCTVMENYATGCAAGGGIYAQGEDGAGFSTALVNSTVSGNVTDQHGGGILATYYATVSLNHCTVTGNTADSGGGGISIQPAGVVQLQSSIVAGNLCPAAGPDVAR